MFYSTISGAHRAGGHWMLLPIDTVSDSQGRCNKYLQIILVFRHRNCVHQPAETLSDYRIAPDPGKKREKLRRADASMCYTGDMYTQSISSDNLASTEASSDKCQSIMAELHSPYSKSVANSDGRRGCFGGAVSVSRFCILPGYVCRTRSTWDTTLVRTNGALAGGVAPMDFRTWGDGWG